MPTLVAQASPAQAHRDDLHRQLAGLDQRIGNILDAVEQLGVAAGDVAERLADLTARKKRVELEFDALEQQMALLRLLTVTSAQIRALIADLHHTLAASTMTERQALLRSFIQQIEIWPDHGQIEYLPPVFQRESWCRGGDSNPYRH
jgi:chromosome segregation ATPase